MQCKKGKQVRSQRSPDGDRYGLYERLKAEWKAKNPGGTPAQYDAAMVALAKRVGV